MAEVLSPIRPTDQYQPGMSPNHNQSGRHVPRGSGYRGSANPVPVHAFKSTPTPSHLRNESKPATSPTSPPPQPLTSDNSSAANRQRYPATESVSTMSSSSSSQPPSLPQISKDDSFAFSSFQVPEFSPEVNGISKENEAPKHAPDRYKKAHKRTDTGGSTSQTPPQLSPPIQTGLEGVTASGSFGSGKLGQFQYNPQQFAGVTPSPMPTSEPSAVVDENRVQTPTNAEKADLPKRYKRRTSSQTTIEAGTRTLPGSRSGVVQVEEPSIQPSVKPSQDGRPSSAGPAQRSQASGARQFASADAVRRINNPSPLSRPYSGESSTGNVPQMSSPFSPNPTITQQSPAAAAMAALNVNEKDSKNSKSRLRRAFSFGSSAELKRATEGDAAVNRAKARQERFSTELTEEQDAVAKQQEASGLGNSIYSGQGGVFAGSTDNLSISSTASSASLMLRKMGKGMKKGGKSIKGLFRPKSVIGVPAADGPGEASVAQVSMVTVEAEREQVNVNIDARDQNGGGTGFPKLERNSIDVARASNTYANGERSGNSNESRRSIVGGEQERQEVLNAVKRGILKRTGTSSPSGSPSIRPVDGQHDMPSPNGASHLDRRGSPVPSATSSEPRRTGHRRTDSHTLEGDDYFSSVPRVGGNNNSTHSLPGTPRSMSRNITFSPRIRTHDVWSSTEYDRRGEIATCNRLTPMLAQQIKEELNTFKMEMEVHESSKTHTHFF